MDTGKPPRYLFKWMGRGKRASKCRERLFYRAHGVLILGRISPRNSPEPPASASSLAVVTPPQSNASIVAQSGSTPAPPPISQQPNPELELELEVASPPPMEDTLAARRARRMAILAKYSTAPSVDTSADASTAASPAPPLSVTPSDASQLPSTSITTSVRHSLQEAGSASPATPARAMSVTG
jgi:hypothetical protein